MGRYYSGDIEGKFWFGVQPSTAPAHLGATETHITYSFSDSEDLLRRITQLRKEMGKDFDKLERFFANHTYYSEEDLEKELGATPERVRTVLGLYADYKLGEKVYNYMQKNDGYCEIVAEL